MENFENSYQGREKNESAYKVILDNFGNYDGLKKFIVEKIPVARESNVAVGSEGFARLVLEDCAGVSNENFEILEKIINGIAREVESLKNAGVVQENSAGNENNNKEKLTNDSQNKVNGKNNKKTPTTPYEHFLNYGEYPLEDN